MFTNSTRQTITQVPLMRLAKLITSFFSIILFTASCTTGQTLQAPPPEFHLVAVVDLAAHAYDEEIVGQFTLPETAVVNIFYTLPNINLAYFDLSLKDTNGNGYLILHSEDYQTDENGGGKWQQRLSSGVYQLVLTAPQSSGALSIYWTNK